MASLAISIKNIIVFFLNIDNLKNINGKFYWEHSISHIISLRVIAVYPNMPHSPLLMGLHKFIRTFHSKIVQTEIKVCHQRMRDNTADCSVDWGGRSTSNGLPTISPPT